MAELFRATRIWDVKDKAEILKPLELNWGRAEFERMPVEYQERLKRLTQTQIAILRLRDGC